MNTKIRIAVQKSGRLNEKSLALLKSCGISYPKIKNIHRFKILKENVLRRHIQIP